MKRKGKWTKKSIRLKESHTWYSPPGYNVFVADRGAVRFNFPDQWIVKPASDCIEILDQQPPDDNCRLAVSYLRLPPIDWTGLPVSELVTAATEHDPRQILSKGEIIPFPRQDVEVAWREVYFYDPQEGRHAFSRLAIARGASLQALITFDFWADDAPRLRPVWDEVLRSVQLGRYIDDPARGDILH